ncbi:MAG: hypothetical protein FJW30_16455 [Acidobacteria bacterium]|nr:hypothetical protein [Acidobacteriota bacterium]
MLDAKTTCPLQTDNADVLLDYCSRSLDPARRGMLERHMAYCSECREMAAGQAEIWSAMDMFDAEPVSADFDRRLYSRIADIEKVPAWERVWAPIRAYLQGQPAWKPVISAAAASAVLAIVILVRPEAPTAPVAAPIEIQEVVEAEKALEDMDMLRQLDAEPEGN